ncbi:MAG TPA: hypothetical protein VGG48_00095 [Rhizomicrobium sp.]
MRSISIIIAALLIAGAAFAQTVTTVTGSAGPMIPPRPPKHAAVGVRTYRDPLNGHEYRLNNRASHWWIDGDGNKIPTESSTPPCPNCRELQIQR